MAAGPANSANFRSTGIAANTTLRAATMGIRAALVLGLALWLGPAELAVFGLVAATVTLTAYVYGLDFYTFTIRQISATDPDGARSMLRDQFLLIGGVYLVGTPALVIVLPGFGLDPALAFLTAGIAALQHAALELYRVLLRLECTLAASLCFFVRDAAWIPACLVVWLIQGDLSLTEVLMFWLAGSVAGTAFAAWSVLRVLPGATPRPVDFAWLARGIRTGLRMLLGTLALRGLFTIDRMILALLAPPEVLGAYVFFTSLCAALHGLFETGILPFFWPRLLEAAKRADAVAGADAERQLARACLIGAPAIALTATALGIGFAWFLPERPTPRTCRCWALPPPPISC